MCAIGQSGGKEVHWAREKKLIVLSYGLCNINRMKNFLGFSFTSVEKILKSNGLSLSKFGKGIY